MKRLLIFLMLTMSLAMTAQTTPSYKNIKITGNAISPTAPFINVQETNGAVNKINKTDLEITANKDNGTLTTSSSTYPTSGVVKAEIDNIKSQINPNTYVVTDAGYTLVINSFTLNSGWSWKINNVDNTNASPVVITVPLATSGYQRVDLIVLNASNTAVRVAGVEAVTPISPAVPLNTIMIASIFSDSTVHTPVIPKPRYPVSQLLRNGITDYSPSEDVVYDALALKVDKNTSITGATNTKITYDSKGLVTSGTSLVAGDIPNIAESQVTNLTTDLGLKAPLASPTFTGTVTLPSTTSIGSVSNAEISYVDGVTSGIQAQLNTKLSSFGSVTTNYLPKVTGTNVFGNSRIFDNGTYLGIGTVNAPTKDLTLGNQSEKEIGIEQSNNSTVGQDLSIRAGKTINFVPDTSFNIIQSGTFNRMAERSNGDVYGTQLDDLYRRVGGTGYFTSLVQGYRGWMGIVVKANGDVLAGTQNQGLYKQTAGTGSFVLEISYATLGIWWWDMALAPNTDIYATTSTGSLYIQTAGTGSFVIQSSAPNATSVTVAPNGDVWIYGSAGIYKQTAGAGAFNFISNPFPISSIKAAVNGDIYITCAQGSSKGIYLNPTGTGSFTRISGTEIYNFYSIAPVANGNIYACSDSYIHMQTASGTGVPNLNGGTLKTIAGTGKGTGSSNWEVYTGEKSASGTNMQIETLRLRIDNEGHITATTMPVYADNTAALSGGLISGMFYRTSTGTLMIVY